MKDVLIIGAGPAGLTAAIYALRSGLDVLVFEQLVYGGQVANTPEVENYPAVKKITGFDFAMNLYEQAAELGAEICMEQVTQVQLTGEVKTVFTTGGAYEGRTVIIANGAKRRKLGCDGEERLQGKGVSYCATCDGAFFKGKDVAIVGGGNTALEDALFLSNNCRKVYLVHRRDTFRGSKILSDAVKARENIEILYDSVPQAILGEQKVEAVRIRNKKEDSLRDYPVSAVFVAVGLEPENQMFASALDLDEAGYFIADETCATKIPGVYVAGDSRKKLLRQIVTAAADGAVAAFQAANYLNANG